MLTRGPHDQVRSIVEAPARLRMAGAGLALDPSAVSWLEQWISTALESGSPDGLACGATLTVTTGALALDVSGPGDAIAPCLGQFLEDCAAGDDDRARLDETIEQLDAEALGYWTEVHGTNVAGGWWIPKRVPLAAARALAPHTKAAEKLGAWAERRGITAATSFGRALGGGNPFAELVLPLPGGTSLADALEVWDATGIDDPAAPFLDGLRSGFSAGAGDELAVAARLTAKGVSRLGIRIDGAAMDPIPALRRVASGGPLSLERVAAFEAFLDAERPDWVEVGILGQGGNLALHYHVGG